MHDKSKLLTAGTPLKKADKVLLLLHGRGARAEDILTLSKHLPVSGFAILAPQATNNTWYPQSFMAPSAQNEPWLSSALSWLLELVEHCKEAGIPANQLYIGGFSQGACLAAEFVLRNVQRFGGIFLFTGGLIGETVESNKYCGAFDGTPVLLTTGAPDPHVPLERVEETASLFKTMGASVTMKVYAGRPHTVSQEELRLAHENIFQ